MKSDINLSVSAVPMRIAAIHDLSCFGRCALTVILPVLSVMGHQVVPVPTALLSTHTGGFERERLFFLDLTDEMKRISDHFYELGVCFDAIYSGFLGDERQIEAVESIIDRFSGKGCPVLIDPVMGDDGELYSTYNDELCRRMRELCSVADIITPNLTEACFLSDVEYRDTSDMSAAEAFELAEALRERLATLTKGKIVITGIPHKDGMFGTYGHTEVDSERGDMYSVARMSKSYPGTGDLFASVLLGSLLHGYDESSAIRFASDYITRVMEYTSHFDTPEREGVAFEHFMAELAEHVRA